MSLVLRLSSSHFHSLRRCEAGEPICQGFEQVPDQARLEDREFRDAGSDDRTPMRLRILEMAGTS